MSPGSPAHRVATADLLASVRRAAAGLVALRWPYPARVLDAAWALFSALNLIAIFWFANWETIPFHFIWISLTVLYGFRSWPALPTMWVLGAVMLTTAAACAGAWQRASARRGDQGGRRHA